MTKLTFLLPLIAVASVPALAEVKQQSDAGFLVTHSAEVAAKPDEVWKRLIAPKDWWNPSHSWSGSTAGFYIDPQAGGCFCELFQEKDSKGQLKTKGSVEHMRVIFAEPGKVLRMQGALGPLQSEAVLGTLTVAIAPLKDGAGSKVSFNYIVGGYTRFPMGKMASAVDGVIGEQFTSMIKPLGKSAQGDDKPAEDWSLDLKDIEEKATGEEAPSAEAETPPADKKPTIAKPSKPRVGKPEKVEPETPEPGR